MRRSDNFSSANCLVRYVDICLRQTQIFNPLDLPEQDTMRTPRTFPWLQDSEPSIIPIAQPVDLTVGSEDESSDAGSISESDEEFFEHFFEIAPSSSARKDVEE